MKEAKLIQSISRYLSENAVRKVAQAIDFAKEQYGDRKTPWGISYVENYLVSAGILLELHPDADTICACLFQKIPCFDESVLDEIEIHFGEGVKKLTDNLCQIIKFSERNESTQLISPVEYNQEIAIDALRRMFLAMSTDLRVITVRLAEKINRLENITYLEPEVRKAYAQEVLDIFVPIAERLGIFQFKRRLEDLAFKRLDRRNFLELKKQFDKHIKEYQNSIGQMKQSIKDLLKSYGLEARVEGRIKGHYSTFKKMKKKNYANIDKVLDLFALRVVLKNQDDCYRVLGLIHNKWQLLPGRFKDYIAAPKVNGYRSLHTAVTGLVENIYDKPIEIQIRTEEMHAEAEFGIAAHWWYKEADTDKRTFAGGVSQDISQFTQNYEDKIQWVKSLVDLHENLKNNREEFSESVKLNLFSDRIFVLTPHGDVVDLPKGATVVDFAYAVHSYLGNHCVRAKVNDESTSLDHELKNSDTVEVQTDVKKTPNRYWLSFVKTTKAREKIYAWFKSLKKEDVIREGKKILNKHLKNLGKSSLDSENVILRDYGGKRLTLKEREEILEDIARQKISSLIVLKKLFPDHEFFRKRPESLKWKRKEAAKPRESKILVTGQSGYETKISSCCKPQFGDSIIGYTTRGGAVSVHKLDCSVIQGLEKSRLISVSWEGREVSGIKTLLRVYIKNRKNILFEVSKVIKEANSEIMDFNKTKEQEKDILEMKIEVIDYEQLDLLINKIEEIDGVEKVESRMSLVH